ARARFHEDHGEGFSGERFLVVRPRTHSFRQDEQTVELLAREVGYGEKVSRHHKMYLRRSSSSTMALRRSRTRSPSTTIVAVPGSGRSNRTSSSNVVITVCSRRAPMASMLTLTRAAMRAIS